jgi:hypothetical protein
VEGSCHRLSTTWLSRGLHGAAGRPEEATSPAREAIRRGTFRIVKDLTCAIGRFIDACNQRCQPFAWTMGAGQILARPGPCAPGGSHSPGSTS